MYKVIIEVAGILLYECVCDKEKCDNLKKRYGFGNYVVTIYNV